MAVTASEWEVRTTGSDTNGGAFQAGATGTDFSQQNAAQIAVTDAVANGTTTLTSATASFTAAHVGNEVYLQGGSGSLAATRRTVTGVTNSTTVTVNASVAAGTGITLNLGGCLASPGEAGRSLVGGNVVWVRAGTYLVTSATANVSGGVIGLVSGTVDNQTRLVGYQAARGDYGTRPVLQASGISSFNLVECGVGANLIRVENVELDGNNRPTSTGVRTWGQVECHRVVARNCTNGGFRLVTGPVHLTQCGAFGCSSVAAFSDQSGSTNVAVGCEARSNTVTGFVRFTTLTDCVSADNTGASSDGFDPSSATGVVYLNCTAANNGRGGFLTNSSVDPIITFVNCITAGNGNAGWRLQRTARGIQLFNCASWNNTGGRLTSGFGVGLDIGAVALTASPFTNAAGGDYSLNTTAGGGAACRGAGVPGAFAGGTTVGYPDLGAVQSQTTGGGGAGPVVLWGGMR